MRISESSLPPPVSHLSEIRSHFPRARSTEMATAALMAPQDTFGSWSTDGLTALSNAMCPLTVTRSSSSSVRIRMLRTELDDDRVSVRGHIAFESAVRPSVDQEPNVSCGAIRAAVAISVDLAGGKRDLISDKCDTGGGKEPSEIRIPSSLGSCFRLNMDHAVALRMDRASRNRHVGHRLSADDHEVAGVPMVPDLRELRSWHQHHSAGGHGSCDHHDACQDEMPVHRRRRASLRSHLHLCHHAKPPHE